MVMLETFPGFLTRGANLVTVESLDCWVAGPGEGWAGPSFRLTGPEFGRGPLAGGIGGGAPSFGGGSGGGTDGGWPKAEPALGGGGGGTKPSLGAGGTGPSRCGGGGTGPSLGGGGSDPDDECPSLNESTPTFWRLTSSASPSTKCRLWLIVTTDCPTKSVRRFESRTTNDSFYELRASISWIFR